MNTKSVYIVVALGAIVIIAALSAFIVDETEQVIITRFGKVVGKSIMEPGLKFKIPMVDKAHYFPKNLLEWDGDPGQIPTLEKTYIYVDSFARWKITDPVKFYQTTRDTLSARRRLDEIIDPAIRNVITSFPLIETVRRTNRKLDTYEVGLEDNNRNLTEAEAQAAAENKTKRVRYVIKTGRQKIVANVLKQAQPKLLAFGIELVDVKIKRINYVEQVRKSIYNRMVAERKQIAEKFRSEGKGEAQKIKGRKEKELKRIESEAYKTAQEKKGKAEAEATRLYAEAYGLDPEFYSFSKTLEIYGETLDEKSTVVLSTDSEFLKFLKGYSE